MKLSQSIIKEVLKYGLCPRWFKARYIDQSHESEPSLAMFRGIYFEYELLDNLPRSGQTPVYPRGKRGKHEIHKSRIDRQIQRFPQIMDEEGIQIICGTQNIEWKYSPGIILTLTLDSLVLYKDRLYVGDIKLSQDLTSSFGQICWGDYGNMDKLQAHLYSYVMSQVMGEEVGFIYMVFDYKKSVQEYRIFEEKLTPEKKDQMFDRIMKAEARYQWMKQSDFRPRAYEKTCKKCTISDCVARFRPEPEVEQEPVEIPHNATEKIDIEQLLEFMNQ